MGRECNTNWKGEVFTEFWWGNQREEDHLEESGVDGGVILK